MRDRDRIAKELNKREAGIGLQERQLQVLGMTLEVLLDIRDLLVNIRDQRRDVVVDFVSPDYGKENEL